MKSYKFTINGNEYQVEIKSIDDNIAIMEVNGTKYSVELHRKMKQTKTPMLMRAETTGPSKPHIEKKEKGSASAVLSPLPGTIVNIFVKPGDIIVKGQKIMSMEAMKMENIILAEKKGVVESIHVINGQSVLQGDILLEII